jgi:hypothetical protein
VNDQEVAVTFAWWHPIHHEEQGRPSVEHALERSARAFAWQEGTALPGDAARVSYPSSLAVADIGPVPASELPFTMALLEWELSEAQLDGS